MCWKRLHASRFKVAFTKSALELEISRSHRWFEWGCHLMVLDDPWRCMTVLRNHLARLTRRRKIKTSKNFCFCVGRPLAGQRKNFKVLLKSAEHRKIYVEHVHGCEMKRSIERRGSLVRTINLRRCRELFVSIFACSLAGQWPAIMEKRAKIIQKALYTFVGWSHERVNPYVR